MASFERFEDIEGWKKERELTRSVYQMSAVDKFSRDYGLRDQVRRAAVSIMSNIAEGFERGGNKEFQHFLAVAKGSAGEVRSQLYVALDAAFINQEQFDHVSHLAIETGRLIAGLMKYHSQSDLKGNRFQ